MSCPHLEEHAKAGRLKRPRITDSVYREDCTQCFDSIDDEGGLDICLLCYNGGCTGDRHHAKLHSIVKGHPLALNVRRTRKVVVRDQPPLKISKLAIAAETEDDKYVTTQTVRCLECDKELDKTSSELLDVVEGIMKANTFSRKEEIKAWELEITTCEHILMLQQDPPRKIASQALGHCTGCDLKENLWLCLQCGNLGCGRSQFGGVGGNSHALEHAKSTKHGVAVKLGSITPEGTADVYCYTCDMERVDENLGPHLAHWGIILAERQKTEKSLTEMQIEQNMKWEFSMTSGDGTELKPLFGSGLTGLKNLGNSCYLASILQCLFSMEQFQKRYGQVTQEFTGGDPAKDLDTQMRKIGDGLLSGRYSKPNSEIAVSEHSPDVPHQKGIAPSMLKTLIGEGHQEFSTMRQQDALELLEHLLKLITRSKHPAPADDPTRQFRFLLEQRLQCLGCKKVRYTTNEQDSILIDVPLQKLPLTGIGVPSSGGISDDKTGSSDDMSGNSFSVPDSSSGDKIGASYKPVTFTECLDRFTGEEVVELNCSACGSRDGFTKRSLFKNLPKVLVVTSRKMTTINWVPVKVDVPVMVDDDPYLLDKYLSKGLQPDEEVLPEDADAMPLGSSSAGQQAAFVPNLEALDQLKQIGFTENAVIRALHAAGNAGAAEASEWLFAHLEDPDLNDPLVLEPRGGRGGKGFVADRESVEMIMAMGIEEKKAIKGLKETGGNIERAIDWVFNHPDDDGAIEEEVADAGGEGGGGSGEVGSSETPAKFQLQSIVCHKGTSIHAGHYVAFIRKRLEENLTSWVLFNDEKVVQVTDADEMKKFAYVYFFNRLETSS